MDHTQEILSLQSTIKDLQTRLDVLEAAGNQFDDARPNLFDIFGTFPTVTTIPAGFVPSTPYDQIQLMNQNGTVFLYVFETKSAVWKSIQLN